MENNISALGTAQSLISPRGAGPESTAQSAGNGLAVNAPLGTEPGGQVQLNQDLPQTSQVQNVDNGLETRTNRANNAEPAIDQAAQQQQIENFLAEQTGEDVENFRGIDVQSALDLQEGLRNRPADNAEPEFSAAPAANSPEPQDANEQQDQELQQRLQARLADQIPNDPGTEFPQLIETVA